MHGNRHKSGENDDRTVPLLAVLDLGTNNCRLLIAAPAKDSFRIVDSFSRIVRLGEGVFDPVRGELIGKMARIKLTGKES